MFGSTEDVAYLEDTTPLFKEEDMRPLLEEIVRKADQEGVRESDALIWWHRSLDSERGYASWYKEDWQRELSSILDNGIYKVATPKMQKSLEEYLAMQAEQAKPKMRVVEEVEEKSEYRVDPLPTMPAVPQPSVPSMPDLAPVTPPERIAQPTKLPILKKVAPKPMTQLALGAGGYFAGKMLFDSPLLGAIIGLVAVPAYCMIKGK